MITVGSPFLPLNKADLADNENDYQDKNHLGVHVSMASMLLVHPQVLVVPLLLLAELVPLDAVPVDGDVGMVTVATMTMTQPCHLESKQRITKRMSSSSPSPHLLPTTPLLYKLFHSKHQTWTISCQLGENIKVKHET